MTRFFFQHWQNGDTNVQTSLTVGTLDINLVATYAPAYIMNITSTPPTVVRFDMGTPLVQEQTPYSNLLQAGTYMLVAEDLTISGYRFKRWSDGIITASRTYVHDHDMTAPLMIEYELIPSAFDFSINASPSSQPVTVGNTTSFAIATALVAGTSQTVTLSVSGLPLNTTSGFSQVSGNPPFASTLNIQTNTNTPTGSYPLTITGSGGGQTHQANVTLVVNPVQVQRGTIQVKALIGSAEVTNATGDIKDSNNIIMDTFAATPHSWDQAVVGVQYTVTCRLAGYADKVDTATVTTEGSSVSKSFQFSLEAGFPWWIIAMGGGGLAVATLIMATRKKKGKK